MAKKILIAEDDNFLANAYRVKLTKAGYEIKIASDGEETISALKSYTPDLVILDLVMPKKDGFAVLAEMKKNSLWSKIPCIVASNLGQKEDIDKAKSLGVTEYIIKTDLSMGKLMEQIRRAAGG